MRTIATKADADTVKPGEAVLLGYPSQCSGCLGQENETLWDGVVLANITKVLGGYHGWWACPDHWQRGPTRRRYEVTGSATPSGGLA